MYWNEACAGGLELGILSWIVTLDVLKLIEEDTKTETKEVE